MHFVLQTLHHFVIHFIQDLHLGSKFRVRINTRLSGQFMLAPARFCIAIDSSRAIGTRTAPHRSQHSAVGVVKGTKMNGKWNEISDILTAFAWLFRWVFRQVFPRRQWQMSALAAWWAWSSSSSLDAIGRCRLSQPMTFSSTCRYLSSAGDADRRWMTSRPVCALPGWRHQKGTCFCVWLVVLS